MHHHAVACTNRKQIQQSHAETGIRRHITEQGKLTTVTAYYTNNQQGADRQIDLAEGLDSLPRRNAMEWRLAGAKLVQSDPHELQGVGVHDVEAAASVHEHLVEAGVADDGIDNVRIPSRMGDVVGVVLAAKGNVVLRPVEVGWRGFGDGENFPALALALPRSHVRRCSSIDEEGVIH